MWLVANFIRLTEIDDKGSVLGDVLIAIDRLVLVTTETLDNVGQCSRVYVDGLTDFLVRENVSHIKQQLA